MAVGEHGEVVDAGRRGRGDRFGSGHGMGVATDALGNAWPHGSVLEADLDDGDSNGSNTQSTRRPTRQASTSKTLPWRLTVAVLVTWRVSDHRNASCS